MGKEFDDCREDRKRVQAFPHSHLHHACSRMAEGPCQSRVAPSDVDVGRGCAAVMFEPFSGVLSPCISQVAFEVMMDEDEAVVLPCPYAEEGATLHLRPFLLHLFSSLSFSFASMSHLQHQSVTSINIPPEQYIRR